MPTAISIWDGQKSWAGNGTFHAVIISLRRKGQVGVVNRRFHKLSELPDHLPSAQLLRSFGNGWTAFLVTNSLVQDQPDQSTLSMCNGSDGLIVSQARDRAAIHDLE